MAPENFAYALTQVVHNFGAVAVLGGAVFALWPSPRLEDGHTYAWLILVAWGAQMVSGGLFGLTSLYYYGKSPEISSVAMAALAVKVLAAITGFLLAAFYLVRGREWNRVSVKRTFITLAVLGATALTAAAFLRWFS
jgi:phosphotransferase system  glucose/maltose/N-acetylglucosamine-specific IIC component